MLQQPLSDYGKVLADIRKAMEDAVRDRDIAILEFETRITLATREFMDVKSQAVVMKATDDELGETVLLWNELTTLYSPPDEPDVPGTDPTIPGA